MKTIVRIPTYGKPVYNPNTLRVDGSIDQVVLIISSNKSLLERGEIYIEREGIAEPLSHGFQSDTGNFETCPHGQGGIGYEYECRTSLNLHKLRKGNMLIGLAEMNDEMQRHRSPDTLVYLIWLPRDHRGGSASVEITKDLVPIVVPPWTVMERLFRKQQQKHVSKSYSA